jgi:hypothetical protein
MQSPTDSSNFPNGGAWAAILAAAIGCVAFGLLVDLTEASKAASNALNFYNPVGDLSGKSIVAVVVWLIAWAVLHARWNNRAVRSPGKVAMLTFALLFLSLLAVFPPFFGLLGG